MERAVIDIQRPNVEYLAVAGRLRIERLGRIYRGRSEDDSPFVEKLPRPLRRVSRKSTVSACPCRGRGGEELVVATDARQVDDRLSVG